MEIVELKCEYCSNNFKRAAKEYRRNLKRKRRIFCSRTCSAKADVSKILPYAGKRNENLKPGKQTDEYSPFRIFLRFSKQRKKEQNIDLKFLKNLWEKQKGICPYTGIKMILPKKMKDYKSSPIVASLDRIDSSKGYLKNNVQYTCLFVNLGKRDFLDEQIKEFFNSLK